jgi:hypothetical protein
LLTFLEQETALIGPVPCFFTRENNVFRWLVLPRGADPAPALDGIDVPKGWCGLSTRWKCFQKKRRAPHAEC